MSLENIENLVIAGIDPGISGAIAFYVSSVRRAAVFDMPVVDGEVSAPHLADLVRRYSPAIGIIENVHAMPKQGVVSMFNFGRSVGDVRGVFAALGIPLHSVTPQKWKGSCGLIGKDKDASRALAIKWFPERANDLQLKKHHGRADALLLAQWGAYEIMLQQLFSPVWRGFASQEDFHATSKGDKVDE